MALDKDYMEDLEDIVEENDTWEDYFGGGRIPEKVTINEDVLKKYLDPNYKPKSTLEQYTDPNYKPISVLEQAAQQKAPGQKLMLGNLELQNLMAVNKLNKNQEMLQLISDYKKKKQAEEDAMIKNVPVKKPFVKKEKFLERIMDKRVAPGEELSNAAKTRLYLKEISKNLLERRKKGGLEGTDTLSRIFGGITEGEEAVTAKEEDILTRREAAIDKKFERDKTVADITKIYAEAQKARLETYKQDYTKEYNKAAEMAELAGHKPGTPGYNAYILQKMERMETLTMGEGAAGIYSKIAELQAQVQFTPEGEERDQLLATIANLTAIAAGLGTGELPENNEQSNEQTQSSLMEGEEE
jgi:hypothetical protein